MASAQNPEKESLAELAKSINNAYRRHKMDADAARRHAQSAREHVKRLSLMLLEARERVGEEGAGWGKWVEENLAFGQRQAQRYLKLGRAHRRDATRVSGNSVREQLASIGSPVGRPARPETGEGEPDRAGDLVLGGGTPSAEPAGELGDGDDEEDGGFSVAPPAGGKTREPKPPRMGGVEHPLLRYRGGKWNLAPDIAKLFVAHRLYVEPYLGSAAVFLSKKPSEFEVLNDVDDEIVNLFEVVRKNPKELMGVVGLTPVAETEVRIAGETFGNARADVDPVERARRFLVISHQARVRLVGEPSYSAATGPTARKNVKLWRRVPETVWKTCQRLRNADLRNTEAKRKGPKDVTDEEYGIQKKDAVSLIVNDSYYEDALVYADPPYVAEKRSKKLYRHDIHDDPTHHDRLVKALADHPGYVYLSGYRNRLYEEELEEKRGWEAREMEEPDPDKPDKEIEILWLNPKAAAGVRKMEAQKKAAEAKLAEAEKRRRTPQHMGMVYTPPPPPEPPEPEIKPEVEIFGSLISAYLEEAGRG